MSKFLIEVPHEGTQHADWGCRDDEHKAWPIIDVGSKDEARNVVPAEYRDKVKNVGLNSFSREELPSIQKRDRG